jgi:general secretion pathway protein N
MKRRYLIAAGVVSFVLALVAYAPAATLYGWFVPNEPPPMVAATGLDGTVHAGRLGALTVRGRPVVGSLDWTLRPWSLLRGRLTYHLQSRDPQLLLDAVVSDGVGDLAVRDLKLNGSVRALMAAAGQPFVPLDGQAGLELAFLEFDELWPVDAEGKLRLVGLSWTLARDPVGLGDYEATIARDGEDLGVLVTTLGGPLDLNGDGRLKPDRSYELHLQLKPKPDAPPMVVNLVRSLGPADAQGYHHIRRQGQLSGGATPAPATP